jgi:hypothetical protein
MRKRTPTKRNLNNLLSKSITKFPSTKSDDSPTITESPLEADFCYHLEFDKEVIQYEAQPLCFEYWYDGAIHLYTADFEVFYEGYSCYYEIKFENDILRDKDFYLKLEAQKKAAIELGKDLLLVTDEFILKPNRYENLCLLYKHSKADIHADYLLLVAQRLKHERLMISELLRVETYSADFQQIYKHIWDQTLITDLETGILSVHSLIRLNG